MEEFETAGNSEMLPGQVVNKSLAKEKTAFFTSWALACANEVLAGSLLMLACRVIC